MLLFEFFYTLSMSLNLRVSTTNSAKKHKRHPVMLDMTAFITIYVLFIEIILYAKIHKKGDFLRLVYKKVKTVNIFVDEKRSFGKLS